LYDLEINYLKVLRYCNKPQRRFSILEHIELYNNSKKFNAYIKPLISADWLNQTIPEKPTSKQQQYFTSALGKQVVLLFDHENKKGGLRTPVASSNIASVGYDAEMQILEIEFQHGAIYQYLDVPNEVYNGLMNAGSKASYFMNEIKPKFEYQQK
jgi:hypothetical protein